MADIEQELTEYTRRRVGGSSPAADACIARAAAQYKRTVKTLQRFGASSLRFWQDLEELSDAVDALLHGFTGNADYYMNARQWDELIYPALCAISPATRSGPLGQQLSLVGDFVIHCHCQALSPEQQRAGARELCRVLAAVPPGQYANQIRYCGLTALGKLLFMGTRRGAGETDYARVYDRQAAAVESAKAGALKLALLYISEGPTSSMADWTGNPTLTPHGFIPPILETEHDAVDSHVVHAAARMWEALEQAGEAAELSRLARWAAGRPALHRALLRKLRHPRHPETANENMTAVRLAVQIATASPALHEALQAAGLQRQLEGLRGALLSLGLNGLAADIDGWLHRLASPPFSDLVELLLAAGGEAILVAAGEGSESAAAPGGSQAAPAAGQPAAAAAGGEAAPARPIKRCAHCGKQKGPGVQLKLCARCKGPHYCGAECQKAAWPEHKKVCRPGPEQDS
ncbi:hypothetical protein ABPG75_003009 [Micractinium tetrahymenae]